MQAVVARLEAWLAAQCPDALAQAAPGAPDELIAATEGRMGVRLPDGLRALYAWRDGGAQLTRGWALIPLADVARLREEMAASAERNEFPRRDWWYRAWVPFMTDGKGSYLVWDPSGSFEGEPGQVLEFWVAEQARDILAPAFDDWFSALVDSLEAGNWKVESGRIVDDPAWEKFLAKRFPGYPVRPLKRDGTRAKPSKRVHGPRADKPTRAADLTKPVRAYRASEKFEPGERVTHPQFGEGIVESLPEPSKITVFFKSGRKVLVHAGSRGESLSRPAPFDHTKPTPKTPTS